MDLENSSLIIDEFIALPIYDNYDFSAGYDSNDNAENDRPRTNTKPKYIRVYMNSGVMIKSGICAGTPVLVEYSENNENDGNNKDNKTDGNDIDSDSDQDINISTKEKNQTVGIAWPTPYIQESEVKLGSLICQNINLKYGQRVRIMRFESDIYEASDIYLKPISPIRFPLDEFLGIYAKEVLSEVKYIMPNNYIEFVYYGRLRRFKVMNISTKSTIINHEDNTHFVYYINTKTSNIHWIPYKEKTEEPTKKETNNDNVGYHQ